MLLVITATPLAQRVICHVAYDAQVQAGERLCTTRLGARTNLLLPRDIFHDLPTTNQRLIAGVTAIGRLQPLA